MPFLCCERYLTRFQLLAAVVFFLSYVMDANSLYPIHLNHRPDWKCDDHQTENDDAEFGQNCTIFHRCPPGNLIYRAPYHSAVQEFGLLCGKREYFATMMSTAYYTGMMVGAFLFGQLSDMYGRKKIVIICCLVVSAGSFGSALADSWITLSVCRMLIGAAVAGAFNVHFTYTLELVAVNQRLFVRCTFNWGFARICFTTFSLFLPYWRQTCIFHGFYPFIVIALVALLIPESPKWLASKGRIEELKKAKEWITWLNGGVYNVPQAIVVPSSPVSENNSGSVDDENEDELLMIDAKMESVAVASPVAKSASPTPSKSASFTAYYQESEAEKMINGLSDNEKKALSPTHSPDGSDGGDDADDGSLVADDDEAESILGKDAKTAVDSTAEKENEKKIYSPKDLFSSLQMTEITLTVWMMWFTASLSSYANDLNSGSLAGDLFVNQYLFGLLTSGSKIFLFLVDLYFPKFSRRVLHQSAQFSIFISYVGIISLLSVNSASYGGQNYTINCAVRIISLIGSVLIEYTWDACLLCAAECFPTVVRSIGTGTASSWARVGGILATQMVYLRNLWEPSPYAAVALVGLVSLLISYRFLPDTKGKELYNQLPPSTGTTSNNDKHFRNGHSSIDQRVTG